jgi:hypothetical protein
MIKVDYKRLNARACVGNLPSLPYIIAAAVRDIDGIAVYALPRPARHHDVIRGMAKLGVLAGREGFLTSLDHFVDRHDAMFLAVHNNQLLVKDIYNKNPDKYQGPDLYSEDLW